MGLPTRMPQFSLETEAHFSSLRMETLAMTGGLVLPPLEAPAVSRHLGGTDVGFPWLGCSEGIKALNCDSQ